MIFPDINVTPEAAAEGFEDADQPQVEGTDTESSEPEGADITGDSESEGGTTDQAEELFELKVDGQVLKLTKDELIARAQKSTAAESRLQQAAKEKKDALRLIELAKTDPLALLKHLQPDLNEKDFFSKRLAQLMEEELLSPQERQHRDDMSELQRLRAAQKDQETQRQQAELDKQMQEQQKVLDVEMGDAIKAAGLPRTQAAVKRVAEYALEALEAGLNIPMVKIAQQVKADMQAEVLELLNQSDEEAFSSLLGKDLLTKAQKASLKTIKKPGTSVTPTTPNKDKKEAPKRTTADDLLRAAGIF
jgi:hypothetical protein